MSPFWQGFEKRAAGQSLIDDWVEQETVANKVMKEERSEDNERNLRIDPRELQASYNEGDFR